MILPDTALTHILLLLSTTAVLSFILDNFYLSFLRGFTLIDSEKLRLISKLTSVASIGLGVYIIYIYYWGV